MSEACLTTEALFFHAGFVPHILSGDTLVVFLGERVDIWSWVSKVGGWCMTKFDV